MFEYTYAINFSIEFIKKKCSSKEKHCTNFSLIKMNVFWSKQSKHVNIFILFVCIADIQIQRLKIEKYNIITGVTGV